jgi:hypothetical protein
MLVSFARAFDRPAVTDIVLEDRPIPLCNTRHRNVDATRTHQKPAVSRREGPRNFMEQEFSWQEQRVPNDVLGTPCDVRLSCIYRSYLI